MSQTRALTEMERFLSTAAPEVLSISGRWGVGKTHAWDETLKAKRATTPLRHYAYVSVFGIKSLDALKTTIVQSTVSLEGKELEPTVESFKEHMSSFEGVWKLANEVTRKSFLGMSKVATAIPYVGKFADLMAPGAALLIRNQIVCIDDIERAGHGLDVADILGLVSSLRERRNCKVVLLLNEDGLGDQASKYREYLEKVVDQAVEFDPTAKESAAAALDAKDKLAAQLADRTISLGITNIRVIRRIRRFFGYLEPSLADLHSGVTEAVISSMALLGWCVFEPKRAPDLTRIRKFSQWAGFIGEDKRSIEDKQTDLILRGYGFSHFDDVDSILLEGLKAGSFDMTELKTALKDVDRNLRKNDVQAAIGRPWAIFTDSVDDNADEFVAALIEVIEKHGKDMSANDASSALSFLRELGQPGEADRLVGVYVDAQADKPREFFQSVRGPFAQSIDPGIETAFGKRLNEMPLERDPAGVLLDIGKKHGWNPTDIGFLASVPVDEYLALLKRLKGGELHTVITAALHFGDIQGLGADETEVAKRMENAVRLIANESKLNELRLKTYLKDDAPPAGTAHHLQTEQGAGPPGAA